MRMDLGHMEMHKIIQIISILLPSFLFSQTYTYNQVGHLVGVEYSDNKSISYGYDKSGNVLNVVPTIVDETDTDGDGISDSIDSDDDNDGVKDSQDAFPLDVSESVDTDGDGIGNNADSDDDNDGMSDVDEVRYGFNPLDASDAGIDADGDGVSNVIEIGVGSNPKDLNQTPIWVPISIDDITSFTPYFKK